MNKFSSNNLILTLAIIISGMLIIPAINGGQFAFAESSGDSPVLVSDKLKNNPLALKIIAEMEAQKLRYKQLSENSIPQSIPTKQQMEIEQNRKISEEMLQKDLKSMEKKYIDFTPKNAFEKYVLQLNSTYHGIFWDQFDYLNAKVEIATAAKNAVLENGGSFYDAQREYFKYASMPRLEMISFIQELNIKYGFANEDIQSNFDVNGKLPRFENDTEAPCYGCNSSSSTGDTNSKSSNNGTTTVSENVLVDPKAEIKMLQDKLSELRNKFLNESDMEKKKSLIDSLNETVRKIQDLTYDKKLA